MGPHERGNKKEQGHQQKDRGKKKRVKEECVD